MKKGKDTIEIAGIKAYSLPKLSEITGVTTNTLRLHIKAGKIKGIKLAGCWYVTEANIKAFFEAN